MAIVGTHPEPIEGPWVEGYVLDRHIVSSRPIGYIGSYMQFDTVYTDLGGLVFRLKNRTGLPDDIIDTAAEFVRQRWPGLVDCVVSPPPSVNRTRQPAVVIAEGIAEKLRIPAFPDAVKKVRATAQMKNVPIDRREALLTGAFEAGPILVEGLRLLIVDDLWDTGATMRSVAAVLTSMGGAEIRALAMTRTK